MDLAAHIEKLESIICDLTSKVSILDNNFHNIHRELQSDEGPTWDSGSTAWIMVSSALVLFMTVPGLILFYVGMVRTKNVLTTVMQIFSITCLITFLWLCFGYSLAFAPALASGTSSPVIGNASRFWLQGLRLESIHQLATSIPESVFCIYQLTFAIITPALMCGSFADRMRFWPMLLFMTIWHLIVYCPIAHSVWHPEGFLFKAGSLDFAGGGVVHIASGISGLVASIVLGHRKNYGKEAFEPHNILYTVLGACMLWVGWYGFNGGSAGNSQDGRGGYAILATQISTAVAALTWMLTEYFIIGQPKVVGIVNGAIAGLVAITPASGYVTPTGAFFIGFFAGPVCYAGANLKHYLGYDDALDAFGIHAVGGMFGGLMTGFFVTDKVMLGGDNGVFYANTKDGGTQLALQLYGIVCVTGWAAFMTTIILLILQNTIGLRVSTSEEEEGLDSSLHGDTLEDKDLVLQRRNTISEKTLDEGVLEVTSMKAPSKDNSNLSQVQPFENV